MTIAQPVPPPPRRNGCLWGCLIVLVIIFLPMILAAGYGTWFYFEGYRRDPVLKLAVETARGDGMAHLVLGNDIHVAGISGDAFSYLPAMGSQTAYVVDLAGSRGEGTLAIAAHTEKGHTKLDSLILAGPDGRHYDLLHHAAEPGVPSDGNSI